MTETARESPRGILLVAFGAGTRNAAPALRAFEEKVRAAFPANVLRWAFTARHAARRPALTPGQSPGAGVAKALSLFVRDGIRRVAVQPLHLVPGAEHAELLHQAALSRKKHPELSVVVGRSLLADEASLVHMAEAMRRVAPPSPPAQEAVIWVGHGARHAAQAWYRDLAALLLRGDPPVFLGTLNAAAGVETLLPELRKKGVARACLVPFFALPGRHAARDMAGKGPGTWRNTLEKAGICCRVAARGMVEHDVIAAMWVDRLTEALAELDRIPGAGETRTADTA